MRPKALITAPFRGPGVERLREVADLVIDPWLDHRPLRLYDAAGLARRIDEEGATIVVCEGDTVAGPVLERPLVAIGSARGDPTNVDVAAATAAGIPVLHAPGRNADAVAELTVGLLLAVTRRIVPADRDVRDGEVYRDGTIPYQRFRAWQLQGRTVGLVGLGAVGRATRWRLEGLGMRVIAADPYAPDATHSLDDLLAEADVVSMHAKVTPETTGLIDRAALAKLREGAVYVNTARAVLHDLDALTEALVDGRLAGAGLDHFEGERLDTAHPLVKLPNVVLTPHIGGATYDTEANHTALLADDLVRILAGTRPDHIVNPEVLG
ncbi:MAG TPA: NAD(P)-dependent oxidoreductase [Acidimicrobiales bacterium]|nr:NAD(P)-dependent oxidoreductase [Acidimicrobiales bacterium]